MARAKNRGYQQTFTPTYTIRRWKMGGYIRLSRKDLQKINRGLDDSNSVKNQRDILNDFHHNHVEEFISCTLSTSSMTVYSTLQEFHPVGTADIASNMLVTTSGSTFFRRNLRQERLFTISPFTHNAQKPASHCNSLRRFHKVRTFL